MIEPSNVCRMNIHFIRSSTQSINAALGLMASLAVISNPLWAGEDSTTAPPPAPPKLEGTWKWSFSMPDGTKAHPKAKLKREGNVLTGISMVNPGSETAIQDGRVEGDQVTWAVVREQAGRKVTTRYAGQFSGETIQGTIESDWAGEMKKYPWTAKRVSDSPTGTWKWEFTFPRSGGRGGGGAGGGGAGGGGGRGGGFRFESTMVLKYENGKLTGKVKGRTSDTEISNAKFENGKVEFEVKRVRNDVTTITKYWGTIDGETIKGKQEYEWNEEDQVVDWIATRADE
jgi:hypothetical protein